MSAHPGAASFAAKEAIESGDWDDYIGPLAFAVRQRLRVLGLGSRRPFPRGSFGEEQIQGPGEPLPDGQVWVRLRDPDRWEPRGTGVVG
jgi:hypothetical protein